MFACAAQIMVSVAEKNQRPDIPGEPDKLPGGTFEGWDTYVSLIQRCWGGEAGVRPTFEVIISDLRELLTASASQTRQRRLTDPLNSGTGGKHLLMWHFWSSRSSQALALAVHANVHEICRSSLT